LTGLLTACGSLDVLVFPLSGIEKRVKECQCVQELEVIIICHLTGKIKEEKWHDPSA